MKTPVGYGWTGFKALSGNADTGQAYSDLYEALKNVQVELGGIIPQGMRPSHLNRVLRSIEIARAALAKHEGRQ